MILVSKQGRTRLHSFQTILRHKLGCSKGRRDRVKRRRKQANPVLQNLNLI